MLLPLKGAVCAKEFYKSIANGPFANVSKIVHILSLASKVSLEHVQIFTWLKLFEQWIQVKLTVIYIQYSSLFPKCHIRWLWKSTCISTVKWQIVNQWAGDDKLESFCVNVFRTATDKLRHIKQIDGRASSRLPPLTLSFIWQIQLTQNN